MQGLRLFVQRIFYAFLAMFFMYLGAGRTDENGEATDSILNFITGAYPFQESTVTLFVITGFLLFWLIANTMALQGKVIADLKNIENTDTRILIASAVVGLAIALS